MELVITPTEQLAELIKDAIHKALALSANEPKQEIIKDKLLTISELREYLPEKPARQTIYGWTNNRKVPFEKHGSKLYFKVSDIDLWLANGRQIERA